MTDCRCSASVYINKQIYKMIVLIYNFIISIWGYSGKFRYPASAIIKNGHHVAAK